MLQKVGPRSVLIVSAQVFFSLLFLCLDYKQLVIDVAGDPRLNGSVFPLIASFIASQDPARKPEILACRPLINTRIFGSLEVDLDSISYRLSTLVALCVTKSLGS
jgi:hypothetical protein